MIIKLFPDFVVAANVMDTIQKQAYIRFAAFDICVNKENLIDIFQKVTIIPTKCVKDQGFYKNAGVENVFNGYECDQWNTRHYREYLDSHPELFSKHPNDVYTLNMSNIKKYLSIGISIRRNAISLCNSMLTQGKYESLLLLRYGLR